MKRRLATKALYHSDHHDDHIPEHVLETSLAFERAAGNVRRFDPYGRKAIALLEEIEGRQNSS